jgi:hypothetical protein
MESSDVFQLRHYQFASEEVITDFSYEAYDLLTETQYPGVQRTAVDSLEGRTGNYTKYDLFCFNTKLAEKIRAINPEVSHHLVTKQYENRIHMCVELYHGYEQIPITKEWKVLLDEAVVASESEVKGKFLFFSAHFDLEMNGVVLKSEWLLSILNYIGLTRYLNYKNLELFPLEPEIIAGRVYMRLHPDTDYTKDKNELKLAYERLLFGVYKEGTVALFPSSPLIERWNLTEVTEGLYRAAWTNVLFAKQKTEFLLRTLVEDNIEIRIPRNKVVRHHIVAKMPYDCSFGDETVIVAANNINEALKASHIVTKALRFNSGDILVVPLKNDTGEAFGAAKYSYVEYYVLGVGKVASYLKL